ncbi:MAG TPA: DUF2207 domain-containing protein [Terriglobales bacterium]|nr:DUF2207 domain-containing protein [Terriglobales bacterium]
MPSAKCPSRAIACVFILLVALPALAREWHITHFDSNMTVQQDGTMTVREHLVMYFNGEYHGIYRDIPIQYPGPRGSNYTLFLSITGVTDGWGHKLKYQSGAKGDYRHLKIYIPDAVNASRSVDIVYTVKNAVRWFDDHDELYWNVTGNDWAVPIDEATATILFPAGAVNNLRAQAFTGVYGSASQNATVVVNGNLVRVAASEPLSMREGLTADVYITKGVLTQPSQLTFALWFLRSNVIVLLPLWAFVVMFFFWWTKGRDPKPDISVAPMYEPPKGMTPAEVGTLVDDAVHPRDITSTLIDLAVKGYIKIEETDSKVLLFTHRDYTFHSLKEPGSWDSGALEAHERVMLNHLFAGGATQIRMSELRNHFYVAIPTIKEDILAELKGKGMYSVDPDSAHGYVVVGVLLTAAPFVIVQWLGLGDVIGSVGLLIAAAIIALIIVFLFARIMTAKSLKGVRTKVEILGLQEFITRVDSDRLKRMPPDTFEKILPYAMALGIENRWAKAFQGIVQNPPTWYAGPTPYSDFNTLYFASAMHNMAMDTHQAFTAAPRASSTGSGWGGGGGGGGFSGGGFGGGGGGAF